MRKNSASQVIGAQVVNATTGAAFVGAVTVYVTGDAGTQAIGSVSSGVCTSEGLGYYTYAPSQSETNYDLIAFTFFGTGAVPVTVQVFTTANLIADVGSGLGTVDADVVDDSRTWFATDYRARNIVTVGDNFAGTLALQPDLNPLSTIVGVTSVSITGAATVTATDLEVNRSKTRAHFTVPALTTTGTYTVVVTVTTVDGQTIPTTATLKVQ